MVLFTKTFTFAQLGNYNCNCQKQLLVSLYFRQVRKPHPDHDHDIVDFCDKKAMHFLSAVVFKFDSSLWGGGVTVVVGRPHENNSSKVNSKKN